MTTNPKCRNCGEQVRFGECEGCGSTQPQPQKLSEAEVRRRRAARRRF